MHSPNLSILAINIVLLLGAEELQFVGAISVHKFLSLTSSEKVALDKFRSKVTPLLKDDCMKSDTYLIRWLRARNLDINSAEQMLRENLRWRKEYNISNIKNEDYSDMAADYHLTIDTLDKVGQPIGVIDIYDWDIRQAILQGKGQRLLRYEIGLVEGVTHQVCERQRKGMNVTQAVVLINADGVNVIQHACPICLPLWIQLVNVIENYFPEWLDEFIVIDAPPAVQIILSKISGWRTWMQKLAGVNVENIMEEQSPRINIEQFHLLKLYTSKKFLLWKALQIIRYLFIFKQSKSQTMY